VFGRQNIYEILTPDRQVLTREISNFLQYPCSASPSVNRLKPYGTVAGREEKTENGADNGLLRTTAIVSLPNVAGKSVSAPLQGFCRSRFWISVSFTTVGQALF